jgi:hypothetical protein
MAGVVGLVVGVNGEEIDSDFIWDLCDQVWLQELLPDVADFSFAGHLACVIGAGRKTGYIEAGVLLDVHLLCSPCKAIVSDRCVGDVSEM